jgi:hypothetical protein
MHEPSLSFNHAALKIAWANELLRNLVEASNAFIKEKPYTVAIKPDPDGEGYVFELGLTRNIPKVVPLLVGDIAGNLRASLDYAWMGLVRAAAITNDKTTLPIASNWKGLIKTIETSPIGGAVEEAKRLLGNTIKTHRDFPNGGNVAIAALNDLSNWNKHNLIVTTAGVTEVRNVTFGVGCKVGRIQVHGGKTGALGIDSGMADNLTYEGEPRVEIIFGAHELVQHNPVVPTLLQLSQAATQALKAFCEAFPSQNNPIFE